MPAPARFYFDFISPYSYLASQLLASRRPRLELSYRPVIFGSMLSKLGVQGPGEIPRRRRAALLDVMLLAERYRLPLAFPPAHPFNSVYALRSVCALQDEELRARLATRYFAVCWGEGKSLEDLSVLRAVLAELGVDQDPEAAATDPANRKQLKANTEELLEAGGWGVPSFLAGEALFFGHDRLELLAAYLQGELQLDGARLEALLARPRGGRIT